MRIGIVGSGIAGLSAAWHLSKRHDVTVLESADRPGGHAWTIQHEGEAVDLGFMVYNTVTYPGITALFDELNVCSRESVMSFAVRNKDATFEYQGSSLNGYFSNRRSLISPRHLKMLCGILRFNRIASRQLNGDGWSIEGSFSEWCAANGIGTAVRQRFLQPIGSAMWSCSTKTFDGFPAALVLRFMANHGMLQVRGRPTWRTVVGGARTYVDAMVGRACFKVRCNHDVYSVARNSDGATVELVGRDSIQFDHVVLACHADQSLALIAEPDEVEQELLSCFPYTANEVVLHRDESLLPRMERARASWNYLLNDGDNSSVITYDLRRLQGLRSRQPLLVTLNGTNLISADLILGREVMCHPAYETGTCAAQQRHRELIDRQGVSYCGAYWGWGFHEDGFSSGQRVSEVLCSLEGVT
jgi:predicted NAD/FAD-binding protein